MDAYARFKALPRGRRGTEVIVIATESELLSIIADAQASEAELVRSPPVEVVPACNWPRCKGKPNPCFAWCKCRCHQTAKKGKTSG